MEGSVCRICETGGLASQEKGTISSTSLVVVVAVVVHLNNMAGHSHLYYSRSEDSH